MTEPERTPGNVPDPDGVDTTPRADVGASRRIVEGARRVASTAVAGAEAVVDSVASAGGRLADLAEPVTTHVAPPVRLATNAWRRAEGRRLHSLRSRARHPLPNLYEVHPEARNAPIRHVGLREVPLPEIAGTAVEGPVQRGGDFLPLPQLRGANWVGRWARIRSAVDRMEILPPIELVHAGGAYWVVDGHNRVAAALYAGQVAIDAMVTAVQLAGDPPENPTHDDLEAQLEAGAQVRAAGAGWLSPGAVALRRPGLHAGRDEAAGDRPAADGRRSPGPEPAPEAEAAPRPEPAPRSEPEAQADAAPRADMPPGTDLAPQAEAAPRADMAPATEPVPRSEPES